MREIRFHPKASDEAFQSARFYEQKRAGLGMEFFSELDRTASHIQTNPFRPPADKDQVRSWRLQRFPFRVYYVADPEIIRVLAVAHLRREPGYWRQRLNQ